jgi:peptide/nickel transport system substrate-binding protein
MGRSETPLRVLAVGAALMLAVGACGGSTATTAPSTAPATAAPGASEAPASSAPESMAPAAGKPGGTVYVLTQNEQIDQMDPQRAYTGEDLAWMSATIYRSLTAYKYSPDNATASGLVPDLATDIGTASADAKTWTFTLRDGVTFQDGSPITCEDIKYGVSRTFATDVINQGPTYAIAYLDIPKDADGSSSYKGPYKGTGQDLFDKSIDCSADGKTITFHLAQPVADFNYTVTLGFSPVPKAADTGESYGVAAPPVASGPYQVESYTTGNGGKLVMVRNPNWNPASDTYRTALPDKWEFDFGVDPKVIDQRMLASTGNDSTALMYGSLQPENLGVVFKDPTQANDQFTGRAVSDLDIYSRYLWIDVNKVKNPKIRQAMAVALDRSAMKKNLGGDFYGDFADGTIKPNIGQDYAPTGLWTDMFGQPIPDTGDVELAKKLIAESGEAAPTLTYNYGDTPVRGQEAAIIKASLEAAGFKVNLAPIEPGKYYSVVFDPAKSGDFGYGGWGADWPNASTVIPPLFTQEGGWDLSQVDDAAFNAKVKEAQAQTDRATQASQWQELNKETMQNMWVIPTFFGMQQALMGSGLATVNAPGGVFYHWGPYGSNPYGDIYVK